MEIHEIIKALSETGKLRATIYLNEKHIKAVYHQYIGAIAEVAKSAKLDAEVSANLMTLLGVALTGGQELSESIAITPDLEVMLIEYQAKHSGQLMNLTSREPQPGGLLTYIGDGQVARPGLAIAKEVPLLHAAIAQIIQSERAEQEKSLKAGGFETIVWLSSAKGHPLASIGSSEWVDWGYLASYHKQPPFGILGRYEKKVKQVVFIEPLWIWHEVE